MSPDITALQPQEVVILLVAIGGLAVVALYRHQLTPLLLVAYGFLLVGAITTNVENLLWHDVFNFVEHSVGNLGAGVAFAAIAYSARRRLRDSPPAGSNAEPE